MRDYAIVTPAFWIGETGKMLRGHPEAQLLALYLMTCPHSTMTGVFHCPLIYMAHETGMTIEGAQKGLARLSEVGFCEYDEASECVFVVRMASYQIGESLKPEDNRHKGLLKEVSKMTPALLRARFIATYFVAFSLEKVEGLASPLEAPPKPRTGTGTRTEIQEPIGSLSTSPVATLDPTSAEPQKIGSTKLPDCPHTRLIDLWAKHLPGLSQPRSWEGARRAAMRGRWIQAAKPSAYSPNGYRTEADGIAWWDGFFAYIANDTTLPAGFTSQGRVWLPDLEWVMNQTNFQKIIDGKYNK